MSERTAEAPAAPRPSTARVGATLAGIVAGAVVVFSLGVMVGSRAARSTSVVAVPPSSMPGEGPATRPAAAIAASAQSPEKLTFYDRLSGVAPAAPVTLQEGPAPAQVLTPAAQTPPVAQAPPPAQQAPQLRPPEPPPPPAPARAVAKKPATPATATVAAKTAAPSSADPAAQIRKLAGKGRFTVQVAAASERSTATEAAALVKRNGFEAVTVMASIKGKIWYRIRVGSFPNKQAATRAAGIFRSAFGLNAIPVEN